MYQPGKLITEALFTAGFTAVILYLQQTPLSGQHLRLTGRSILPPTNWQHGCNLNTYTHHTHCHLYSLGGRKKNWAHCQNWQPTTAAWCGASNLAAVVWKLLITTRYLSGAQVSFNFVNPTWLVSRWLWIKRRNPLSTQALVDPWLGCLTQNTWLWVCLRTSAKLNILYVQVFMPWNCGTHSL